MKSPFVKDLAADQVITGFFLVHEKEVRNTNTGKPYLRMELGDRSGSVEARMWEQFEACAKDGESRRFREGTRAGGDLPQ